MNSSNITTIMICAAAFVVLPTFAQPYSGLSGFSRAFIRDLTEAAHIVGLSGSTKPLIALQGRYTNEVEQAELEVTLGFLLSFRTDVADPSNAVAHLTTALNFDLPEKTLIDIYMYRGNGQEQLKKPDEALKDYLRGLMACTYHDFTGGWPAILAPKVPIFMNSPDPENHQRVRDYNLYRRNVELQRFFLRQRYYFIEAVKRVRQGKDDLELGKMLEALSPDSKRTEMVIDWLKSQTEKPWP